MILECVLCLDKAEILFQKKSIVVDDELFELYLCQRCFASIRIIQKDDSNIIWPNQSIVRKALTELSLDPDELDIAFIDNDILFYSSSGCFVIAGKGTQTWEIADDSIDTLQESFFKMKPMSVKQALSHFSINDLTYLFSSKEIKDGQRIYTEYTKGEEDD